jgi:hypothetical protein
MRAATDEGERWVSRDGRGLADLAALVRKHGSAVPGLADACAALPDDPSVAVPAVVEAREDLVGRFRANDWRRDDYPRVIRQDTQIRLVVEPSGERYRLQWVHYDDWLFGGCNLWRTVCMSDRLQVLRDYIGDRVHSPGEGESGKGGVRARADRLMADLPEFAREGLWPELPARP